MGRGLASSRLPWRAGLAQLPVSPVFPLWAHVFWDQGCQLLELPAEWAKALRALESCLLPLPPQLLPPRPPSADSPSCSFKAPRPSAGSYVSAEWGWVRDWPGGPGCGGGREADLGCGF